MSQIQGAGAFAGFTPDFFIRVDGTSTTTAAIPFEEGLTLPLNEELLFGSDLAANSGDISIRLETFTGHPNLSYNASDNDLDDGTSVTFNAGHSNFAGAIGGYIDFRAGRGNTTDGDGGFIRFLGGGASGAANQAGRILLLGGAGSSGANYGYTAIDNGGGVPGHFTLTSSDTRFSLYVNKALEVDGATWLDGALTVAGQSTLATTSVEGLTGQIPLVVKQEAGGTEVLTSWVDTLGTQQAWIDIFYNFTTNAGFYGTSAVINGSITGATLSLTGDSNQIILDSDNGSGFTTTLTDSSTAARVITFPDATTTLAGLAVANVFTQNQTILAASPTLFLTASAADDYSISNNAGAFAITNTTDNVSIISATSASTVSIDSVTSTTFSIGKSTEMVLTANNLTFENGVTDTALNWSSSGVLAITAASLTNTGTITSSGNITITNTAPALLLTDTTASEDDYTIDLSGGVFRIRNTTDSSNIFQGDGSNNTAISTSYAPNSSQKLFVQDRTTSTTAAARAAFTATQEIVISGAYAGSNQRGFLGGVSFVADQNYNNGASMIGLEGGTTIVSASGTQNNAVGLFGTIQASGGSTVTNAIGVSTFVSNASGTTITNLKHFAVGSTSNSATITTVYGFYTDAITAGGANYEGWMGTDAGWFFREAGNQINSRAAATLDLDATTTMNFRIGGTIEASLTATVFNITGEADIDGALNHDGTTVGFFGAAPVTQRTNIGVLTDSTGGAVDGTLNDVGAVPLQAVINDNFADLADRVNKIEQVLQDLGLTN